MPNIVVKGKGPLSLTKNEFVGAGGEGQVYAKSGTAYKLYTDPSKMIPEEKIRELAAITEPYIIRPNDVLTDTHNQPLGYSMRYVQNTHTLVSLFTKAFKQRHNLTPQNIFDIVQKIQKGVHHIHEKGILIVDCNEMNFLVSQSFDEVYFIDVDSYQTKSHRATALMESVRDRHCHNNAFTKETDWFAWGVITFQLFIGIHPYKGVHKKVKTLDDRMLANISVFNPDVGLPAVCEPLDSIPQNYRDWYKAVFEQGKRIAPPTSGVAVILLTQKVDHISGSNKFDISLIEAFGSIGEITNVIHSYGDRIVQGKKGVQLGSSFDATVKPDMKLGFTPQMNHAIAASVDKGKVNLYNINTGKTLDPIPGAKAMSYDSRLYVKNGNEVYEVKYIETPLMTKAMLTLVASVMDKATTVYDGVLVQNLLESTYVSVFPKTQYHAQIRIKEIEQHRIIDAKFDRGVLMMVGADKKGKYDRFVIRFSADYLTYDIRMEHDIFHTGLNFVVLNSGVCVHIDEEEKVNVFRAVKDDAKMTVIEDPAITGVLRLYRWENQAVVVKGDKLYNFKMKP